MAKISELPRIVAPTGRETVPVVDEAGATRAAAIGELAVAAAAPAVEAAENARDSAAAIANFFPSLEAAVAAGLAPDTLFSTHDGTGTLILYRQGGTSPVEIGRMVTAQAVASEIAKNRSSLFTTGAQPAPADSQVGDQWLSPAGTFYTRTPANGLTIAGKVLLVGGKVPVLPWKRADSQPFEAINARLAALETGAP